MVSERKEKQLKMDFPCRIIFTCLSVNFTRGNRIEALYERSRVEVQVEPLSAFTFTLAVHTDIRHLYFGYPQNVLHSSARENYATV